MPDFLRSMFKFLGIILGLIVVGVAIAMGAIYFTTEQRLEQVFDVPVNPIPPPTDPRAIARGRHMVRTVGFCVECHGNDLAGDSFDEGPAFGTLVMSNLTPGNGGVGSYYTREDWIRAIRHGIGPDGKPLVVMPSHMYNHLSDSDLAAMIAYLQSLRPVDKQLPEIELRILARIFILQDPALIPADIIVHDAPRPPSPEPGVSAEYGEYLAISCRNCHGNDLSGSAGVDAGMNLTPAGDLKHWTEQDFLSAIRTGTTPEGRQLDNEKMPWKELSALTDDELKAIWLYLVSLPPVEVGFEQ